MKTAFINFGEGLIQIQHIVTIQKKVYEAELDYGIEILLINGTIIKEFFLIEEGKMPGKRMQERYERIQSYLPDASGE